MDHPCSDCVERNACLFLEHGDEGDCQEVREYEIEKMNIEDTPAE